MEISLFRFSLFVIQRSNDILHALWDRTLYKKLCQWPTVQGVLFFPSLLQTFGNLNKVFLATTGEVDQPTVRMCVY